MGSVNRGTEERTQEVARLRNFEVCVSTHVALLMFIVQVLASQLDFHAELAFLPFSGQLFVQKYALLSVCYTVTTKEV